AASCSVSDRVLFQCLEDNLNIRKVFLCFDSDSPGQSAARSIAEKLKEQNIDFEILVPTAKDWNEDLLSQSESEAEACQVLQF
ncbi:MAG: toprim domain-containing protein, partial [Acutalibacteraceae bacterium]